MHGISGDGIVEDHAMRGQVDFSFLRALKQDTVLTGKFNRNIVAEQDDAETSELNKQINLCVPIKKK